VELQELGFGRLRQLVEACVPRAFESAWTQATTEQGANRDTWRWGALHTATFVSNPLGLSGISLIENIVNRGPVETGGGAEIVNATGNGPDFTVDAVPSMRMIVDFSDFDNSRTIHTTGQSGHPYSDHYGDMIETVDGELFPTSGDFFARLNDSNGEPLNLSISRPDAEAPVDVTVTSGAVGQAVETNPLIIGR